jgi:hypothetical protein
LAWEVEWINLYFCRSLNHIAMKQEDFDEYVRQVEPSAQERSVWH